MKHSLRRLSFQVRAPKSATSDHCGSRKRLPLAGCLLVGLLVSPDVAGAAESPFMGRWRWAEPEMLDTNPLGDWPQ